MGLKGFKEVQIPLIDEFEAKCELNRYEIRADNESITKIDDQKIS